MARLDAHYEAVRERNGLAPVDFPIGDGTAPRLRDRFVAVDGRDAVAAASDRETLVCTGVGMTGPPHLGTVGQMLTAIGLQEAGLDVQFVLADLEPYHGGAGRETVDALADQYRAFLLDLGFVPEQGTLRTQSAARDVMHTGHLLARYYRPDAWDDGDGAAETAWERAVRELYDGNGDAAGADDGEACEPPVPTDGPTSPAASHHSAVLHGADFLHPLWREGYEQVVICLGIDEYGLTPRTRRFRDASPVEGTVAGLSTRMVPGPGDSPKMSKSVPGSGVHLAMAPYEIRDWIVRADADPTDPGESPVFQAMRFASEYGPDRLDGLRAARRAGGADWERATREYADDVADLAARWRRAGE